MEKVVVALSVILHLEAVQSIQLQVEMAQKIQLLLILAHQFHYMIVYNDLQNLSTWDLPQKSNVHPAIPIR